MSTYYMIERLDATLDEAIDLVTSALSEEGFHLLTQIDVQSTIDKQLGIEVAPYRILGFLNSNFAHQIILIDHNAGTLLPSSVVVRASGTSTCDVSWVSPRNVMAVAGNSALTALAEDATRCFQRGLAGIGRILTAYA